MLDLRPCARCAPAPGAAAGPRPPGGSRGSMKLRCLALPLVVLLTVGLFMSRKMFLSENKDPSPQHVERLIPSSLRLLPEEKYMSSFSYSGIRMFPKKPCKCEDPKVKHVDRFQDALQPDELESVKQRRKKEFEHFKKRYRTIPRGVLTAQPNSPLSYPLYGVELLPLSTTLLPGLGVHVEKAEPFQVTLTAALGAFNTLADVSSEMVQGRGEKEMTISSPHLELVNFILQHTTYTSTVYNIHDVDTERNINSLVTIVTKTFLRYQKLNILIKSIHKYYPNITIIVADDNDQPEKILEPNVEQYFMPFAKGWFAGRNLAVSQVTTKYFLWVDDDFIFIENTTLEKLVDVLEATNLDLVGGNVDGNFFSFRLLYEEGDEDGDCVHWREGSYGPIEGFPNCVFTGGVVNFFMAHTVRVQSVGFDPKLARVAHTEFFIDGMGSLLVGSCKDITVGHQKRNDPVDPSRVENMKRYGGFRTNTGEQVTFKMQLHYFKNRLKCYTKN
ncbi:beta-1,4 N-acetylgalactosaminyltransferase 2-like isoform X2 [Lissotriton helveticus]